ncbi:Fe-S cluster assembly protein SufD [Nakamurella endophytica]|uniref:Fe-S cluster assembly protein SufD n=1 Tax=Nakamurella endophytica TaxID=1748367 RepID=A0A917SSD1_9ACTN|nr:Fe-S cluster assembly protein SufD [Nakamurella endophytica]GGL93916.1 Fe-S cluster assembly protein SufD [Nakamurella endophytica]
MAAPTDTAEQTSLDAGSTVVAPAGAPEAHSHVGGRTVRPTAGSHLHPTVSADPEAHRVPTGREEVWRFTPLRRLRDLHADAPFGDGSVDVDWQQPDGVRVAQVRGEEAVALRGASGFVPTDRTSARVLAETGSAVLVDVPAGAVVTEPVVVTVAGRDTATAEAGHVVVRVGAQAHVDVVLVHEGSATLAQVVELQAGDASTVSLTSLQEWAGDAVHLSRHHLSVGRDATVKHAALTFGGDLVRVVATVDYAGPGGSAELLGLYFADAGQHLEHRVTVDHDATHCRSRALYKGALQGEGAHTVWVGDVLIRASAEGTDTYEMNRNLVLTDGARADSVPNLEIETGEIVGAGHASSTGRFDDEQLFYLQSRGIPEDVARRLVVRGFFAEVVQRIGLPLVADRATEIIERELALTGS